MAIKAIQTKYKGYHFRSRLEARWAVFFDALGLQWEYEPEGFDLGDAGWYLPDFYLPEFNMWVEIKGAKATDDELEKCEALWNGFGQKDEFTDLLWLGDEKIIDDIIERISVFTKQLNKYSEATFVNFGENVRSRKKVYCFEGLLESGYMVIKKDLSAKVLWPENVFKNATCASKLEVISALHKARSARFEHGETPK